MAAAASFCKPRYRPNHRELRKTAHRGPTITATGRIGREGMPVTINKIEDIGRNKIVRATFAGLPLTAVAQEDDEIPADPRVSFDLAAINIYADSWRVKTEA